MRARAIRKALLAALLAIGTLVATPQARAQDNDNSGPVSPDSADVIRASLGRPPPKPPFDAVDAVALPFRIVLYPVRLLGYANVKLVGLVTRLSTPREYGLFQRIADAGFRPAFGSVGERSGFSAGLRFDRYLPLFLETAYSIRGSQRHVLGLDFNRPLYRVEASYLFQRDAEPHFWGVGPDSEEDQFVDYRWDRQIASALGTLRFPALELSGGFGYQDNRVSRGSDHKAADIQDLPQEDQPYGVDARTKYFVFDLTTTFDRTYNRLDFQRRGVYLQLGTLLFLGTDGTESDFVRVSGVLHSYVPLNVRQSFALRGLIEANRGWGEGVPFYHLARLGDKLGSRAYKEGRFRDRDMLALMTEWRYEVWRELHERGRVESFLFLDSGTVDHKFSEMRFRNLKWSWGFGFRVVWSGQTRWLAYLGFGEDGARLNVDFSWVY